MYISFIWDYTHGTIYILDNMDLSNTIVYTPKYNNYFIHTRMLIINIYILVYEIVLKLFGII